MKTKYLVEYDDFHSVQNTPIVQPTGFLQRVYIPVIGYSGGITIPDIDNPNVKGHSQYYEHNFKRNYSSTKGDSTISLNDKMNVLHLESSKDLPEEYKLTADDCIRMFIQTNLCKTYHINISGATKMFGLNFERISRDYDALIMCNATDRLFQLINNNIYDQTVLLLNNNCFITVPVLKSILLPDKKNHDILYISGFEWYEINDKISEQQLSKFTEIELIESIIDYVEAVTHSLSEKAYNRVASFILSAWYLSENLILTILERSIEIMYKEFSSSIVLSKQSDIDRKRLLNVKNSYEKKRFIQTLQDRFKNTYRNRMRYTERKGSICLDHMDTDTFTQRYTMIQDMLTKIYTTIDEKITEKLNRKRCTEIKSLISDMVEKGISIEKYFKSNSIPADKLKELKVLGISSINSFRDNAKELCPSELDLALEVGREIQRKYYFSNLHKWLAVSDIILKQRSLLDVLIKYPNLVQNEKIVPDEAIIMSIKDPVKLRAVRQFQHKYANSFRFHKVETFLDDTWMINGKVVTRAEKEAGIQYVRENHLPMCLRIYKECTRRCMNIKEEK